MNNLNKQINSLVIELEKCLNKHNALRESHKEIKNGYDKCIEDKSYMRVKSVSELFQALDAYELEYGRLIQSGVTLHSVESKLRFIPIKINVTEVINSEGTTTALMDEFNRTIKECANSLKRLEVFQKQHEQELALHAKEFNRVTELKE